MELNNDEIRRYSRHLILPEVGLSGQKKICSSSVLCFFFSSRRRHTRCSRDWSSDVCSSDLLYNYPRGDQNQQYLITGLSYHLKENPRVSAITSVRGVPSAPSARDGAKEEGSFQRYELQAQPTSLAYTPARTTPKPRTTGPQTAVVVGPAGQEIWTDEYGRIKVQFPWDRLGKKDQNSGCWIR